MVHAAPRVPKSEFVQLLEEDNGEDEEGEGLQGEHGRMVGRAGSRHEEQCEGLACGWRLLQEGSHRLVFKADAHACATPHLLLCLCVSLAC